MSSNLDLLHTKKYCYDTKSMVVVITVEHQETFLMFMLQYGELMRYTKRSQKEQQLRDRIREIKENS